MFRVSIAPIIRSTSNCNCRFCIHSVIQHNPLFLAPYVYFLQVHRHVNRHYVRSGLRRTVNEIFALLGCYAAYTGSHRRFGATFKGWEVSVLTEFYIHGSVQSDYILMKSNEMQQYAGVYLLQNYSTCFGCLPNPSSGVHQTVTAVSGTGHITCQSNNLPPAWSN